MKAAAGVSKVESCLPPFSLHEFFDKIFYINLDCRKDRKVLVEKELRRVKVKAERFCAINGKNKFLAFNKSQHEVLKMAGEQTLILEDDVMFRSMSHLREALSELPWDWDMLYLGANINGTKLEKYSKYLFKVRNSFTTHAVGYSKKMAEWIVENFPFRDDKYEPDYDRKKLLVYDQWLAASVQEKFKCFLVAPMVAYQRPSFSDLQQRQEDYTQIFQTSEQILGTL